MWKYLGWPLAGAAIVGAYIIYAQGAKREAALQAELTEAQQLVAQVSNRLAVVEAQFNTYKITQDRDMRELREKLNRDKDLSGNASWRTSEPAVEKRPATIAPAVTPEEQENAQRREDYRTHRPTSNNGRSIGEGINSLLDRIRDGFNN